MLSRRVPQELQNQLKERFLEELIDKRLMKAFLKKNKIRPAEKDVAARIKFVNDLIRKGGDKPEEILPRLGFTENKLRDEVSLPLTWELYMQQVITQKKLQQFYKAHQKQFDGTKIRASQIMLKLKPNASSLDVDSAKKKLDAIQGEISSGKSSFAEAAKKSSESPSGKQGGDVGFFPYSGVMSREFSEAGFSLKVGEISKPFRTRFGLHMLTVTEIQPGQLSLEDVRKPVLNAMGKDLWSRIVSSQRTTAKIERTKIRL
jgi:peptidyl-prolyl cis-trans isomerase C